MDASPTTLIYPPEFGVIKNFLGANPVFPAAEWPGSDPRADLRVATGRR